MDHSVVHNVGYEKQIKTAGKYQKLAERQHLEDGKRVSDG